METSYSNRVKRVATDEALLLDEVLGELMRVRVLLTELVGEAKRISHGERAARQSGGR